MAHPQNKHDRFLIGMKKGLKRAFAHNGYVAYETFEKESDRFTENRLADYIRDTRAYRDTTTNRGHTGEHSYWEGEVISEFKARKHQESLKNLELAYEPIKAYDLEYLYS